MRQLKITKQVTNREAPSLDRYLHEISKVDLITTDEEEHLALQIKKGDYQALARLVKANLRFVVSVAKQYQNQGLSLPDLINEGNLGLIKAAQRFDETKGFKFISYAVWWIRQSILQALAEQARIVRLPLNKIGNMNKVSKVFSLLEQRFERIPTDEEIAAEMDIPVRDVEQSLMNNIKHVSMDAPIGDDDDNSLYDIFSAKDYWEPDNDLNRESLCLEIERSLSVLTEREADIIRLFYGLNGNTPFSLEEIGEKFDLTRERVRQIREKAIKKLKSFAISRNLKNFL
ncbi:MAG TPA: RNA polymerase subunit sigma [Bacteroidales bacterium]|nr:RNA polymerase subunit sigma [Bacteroidales bacterium]